MKGWGASHSVVRLAGCIALGVAMLVAGTETTSAAKGRNSRRVVVMSRNLYLGTDIGPAVFAIVNNPQSVPQVMGQLFSEVHQTDIEQRAEALADEIAEARPHVIGVQEAAVWRTQFPSDELGADPVAAETVEFDFLESVRRKLRKRGLRYRTVVTATGVDVEFPMLRSEIGLEDVRLTVRDAILVRHGVRVRKRQASNYESAILLPFASGTLPLLRQWVAVDVLIRGRRVRFISTHLEDDVEFIQTFQARELLAWPADFDGPVVIMGDLNSDPAAGHAPAPYHVLTAAGFEDSWLALHPGDPGPTWGHAPLLDNEEPELSLRIDHIMTRGGIAATSAEIIGDEAADRIGGLWPSDHAGLVMELRVDRKDRP